MLQCREGVHTPSSREVLLNIDRDETNNFIEQCERSCALGRACRARTCRMLSTAARILASTPWPVCAPAPSTGASAPRRSALRRFWSRACVGASLCSSQPHNGCISRCDSRAPQSRGGTMYQCPSCCFTMTVSTSSLADADVRHVNSTSNSHDPSSR